MKLHHLTRMGSGEDIQRRTWIGGALAALLSSRAAAQGVSVPHDPFILLLQGIYQAVPPWPPVISDNGDNLGLKAVHINDGSYSRTLIYPVLGVAGSPNEPIGNFYVQFNGDLCAYDLPGGAIAMQFTKSAGAAVQRNFGFVVQDRVGGYYFKGTFELTILEATGVYSSFKDGHNHMVDTLHKLSDGISYDEYCVCHISKKDR